MPETSIFYKRLNPIQIAYLKTVIASRDQLPPLFDRLRQACGEAINGKPLAIFHGGAVKDGILVEAAFPVSRPVEYPGIYTRLLEPAPALTVLHFGPHQAIRDTVLTIYAYLKTHPWTVSGISREVYHIWEPCEPEKNISEIQVVLHEWDRLLAQGVEAEFGTYARRKVMQGITSITPSSSFEEYTTWIQTALERLDRLTVDEARKCQAVSHCAHVFPQERIDHLRHIYAQENLDAVLREMYTDDYWYEKPVRRGNVIYMRKNPYNPEAYASAATPTERRKAYCHCRFVHPFLEDGSTNGSQSKKLSPTFCFCGAGWYRRLWEGILGLPVKLEYHETILRGNDQCTFTITLPLNLVGECAPES